MFVCMAHGIETYVIYRHSTSATYRIEMSIYFGFGSICPLPRKIVFFSPLYPLICISVFYTSHVCFYPNNNWDISSETINASIIKTNFLPVSNYSIYSRKVFLEVFQYAGMLGMKYSPRYVHHWLALTFMWSTFSLHVHSSAFSQMANCSAWDDIRLR